MRREEPWATHYRMWTYVTEELPALVAAEFPVDMERQAITGHSMGGHGALTRRAQPPGPLPQRLGLRADRRAGPGAVGAEGARPTISATIARAWRKHDAVALIEDGARVDEILVDVGTADPFIEKELRPELLEAACADGGHRADAAPAAGVRPQLLFHLDVHGRSFAPGTRRD